MPNANPLPAVKNTERCNLALWALMVVYAWSRILQVFPNGIPVLAIVALHVVPPALFALIHGARFYRVRGILVFVGIGLVVGNIFKNLGVRTGFPFGRYFFTDVMDPKILVVPVLLGLAYVATATVFTMGVFALLAWIKRPGAGSRPNVTRQPGLVAQETMMG
jgi:uncharacterized membrane protein